MAQKVFFVLKTKKTENCKFACFQADNDNVEVMVYRYLIKLYLKDQNVQLSIPNTKIFSEKPFQFGVI